MKLWTPFTTLGLAAVTLAACSGSDAIDPPPPPPATAGGGSPTTGAGGDGQGGGGTGGEGGEGGESTVPRGGTAVFITNGGGKATSPSHRLTVSVGAPQPMGKSTGPNSTLEVGPNSILP